MQFYNCTDATATSEVGNITWDIQSSTIIFQHFHRQKKISLRKRKPILEYAIANQKCMTAVAFMQLKIAISIILEFIAQKIDLHFQEA